MGSDLRKSIFVLIISVIFFNCCINAQLLDDTTAISLVRSGIDKIYNLQFDDAEEIYTEIKRLYSDHPVEYLFHGMMVYWQNYPLLPGSPQRSIYEDDMKKCIRLSEKRPYSKDHEGEAVLSNLCARGLLLLFYADNEMSVNVIPVATSTYKYIMRSFDFNKVYTDLNYFTGLYNYYRDAYPKFHPVYKTVAILFPPGSMQTGLSQLNIAAEKSIILRAEAQSILAWIYTYYESNFEVSLTYTGSLCEKYPANPYFRSLHIKNLMLLKKYDEAEKYIEEYKKFPDNKYFNAELQVYHGLLQEKKYKNYESARKFYNEGLIELTDFGEFGKEFSAYAWFGLSRLNEAAGNRTEAKKCHRKALEDTNFRNINFD